MKIRRFSPKQVRVLSWWLEESGVSGCDGIIADGAIRSGKTVCMALSFVLWSMTRFSGENFGLCGKTVGSFRRNVMSILTELLPRLGFTLNQRRSDNLLIISRGEVSNHYYIFGGKDEGSQDLIQGITLAGILLDEVALMPESFVNQATGRCSVEGAKLWFNCNPEGPEHWFKKRWVDMAEEKGLLHIHFTMDDNLSLSPKMKARYRQMYTGVFQRRYIYGQWCAADGLVYQFDENKHICHDVPKQGRWFISCDYGTLNPFSAGLWCVSGGRAVRVAEYYYNGRSRGKLKTDEEYYAALEELAGDRYIECVVVDPSASGFIACIRRHGRFSVRKAKNDVLQGIGLTAEYLRTGVISVAPCCTDAIREFSMYRWEQRGQVDKPVKEHDHAMDDIRYFCATVMARFVS